MDRARKSGDGNVFGQTWRGLKVRVRRSRAKVAIDHWKRSAMEKIVEDEAKLLNQFSNATVY